MDNTVGRTKTNMQFTNSRSVMQKKFKINDGAKEFIESNTLLEPANNAAALQHDQEEIREVSTQLSQIKKKHDEAKKMVVTKQEELEKVKKEIISVETQEAQAEGPVFQIKSRLEQLREALNHTEGKISEENMNKATYLHMLDRMKKDFIATKIKTSDLDTSLRSKSQILEIESGKQRKTKEEKLQSRSIFDGLMKNIEKEQKDRQERIFELQKCIKNKEESVQRRIERQRRNQEIAEAAANENKDSSERTMRENLLIQRLWNTFMRRKMEKEMRDTHEIDNAFQQIKTNTGITDVQEMVKRFLTREQTYSHLLVTVSASETQIDKLKKENEELSQRLHELKIDTDVDQKEPSESKSVNIADLGENDAEIIQMNNELQNTKKDYGLLQERFKRINIVNDQVSNWAKRVYNKFGVLTEDPIFQQDPTDLTSVFKSMGIVVGKELGGIKERRDEEGEEPGIEYGDVFNDFATGEFLTKNNRVVRPISGVTHGDDTRDGRQSNISKGMGTDGIGEDIDENFNKVAISDLDDQRAEIKKRHIQLQVELQKKKQAEEKEKDKKNR